MKAKTITIGFTIKYPNCRLHPSMVLRNRNDVISRWIGNTTIYCRMPWKDYYKKGYRCVKVQITEVKPK